MYLARHGPRSDPGPYFLAGVPDFVLKLLRDRVDLSGMSAFMRITDTSRTSRDVRFATLLGRPAACSLDGLRAQPHDTVSAFTGSVN
jgi:hypothetical protein